MTKSAIDAFQKVFDLAIEVEYGVKDVSSKELAGAIVAAIVIDAGVNIPRLGSRTTRPDGRDIVVYSCYD